LRSKGERGAEMNRLRLLGLPCGALLGMVAACAVGALAVLSPMASGAASTSLSSCTDDALVPVVSSVNVAQGLPYVRLARGKQAVVRAYLTTPATCALTRRQSLTPTAATLTVGNGSPQAALANSEPLAGILAATV